MYLLKKGFSKCGLWTSGIITICKLAGNAKFWAEPRTYWKVSGEKEAEICALTSPLPLPPYSQETLLHTDVSLSLVCSLQPLKLPVLGAC